MVTINKEGSGYIVDWPEYEVTANVKHIRDKATFKAQVRMSHGSWVPDKNFRMTHVHRANPVLDSTSGMDSFARKCNKNLSGEDYAVPWDSVIEDLAGIVMDTHRAGTAEMKLSEVSDTSGVTWQVENILLSNSPTVIFGSGGTGKSMFSLFLSIIVQQGYMNSSHHLMVEPGNVLYLDWETDAHEIANRARMIHKGLGIDAPSSIIYRECGVPLADDLDRIKDIVFRRSIDMVVIDSMGLAVGGELESAEVVLNFFRAVRQLNCTSLIISHTNRSGTIFGSAYTINSARLVWEAKKTEGTSILEFNMFNKKTNNVALQPAQTWGLSGFADEKVSVIRGDIFKTDAAGLLSYDQLVYRTIKEQPRSRDAVLEKIKGLHADPVEVIKKNVSSAISKRLNTATEPKPFKDGSLIREDENDNLVLVYPDEGDESWSTI